MVGPIASVVLIVVAGLMVVAMFLLLVIPALRHRPVRWKLPVAGMVLSLAVGVYAVASLASWAAGKAWQAVQKAPALASDVIGSGTSTMLEGLGKTQDHFAEKWKNEALADLGQLQITPRGPAAPGASGSGSASTVVVEILVKNPTARDIDFGRIIQGDLLLAQDDQGVSYKPQPVESSKSSLPAGTTTRHRLEFEVDPAVRLTKLTFSGAKKPLTLKKN